MATIYWAGAKAPKEEAVKALMKELAEWTEKEPPDKFMGWRLIRLFVPNTYIDTIILAKERDNA